MKLIVFSKSFREKSLKGLVETARETGFEGYDLCVRNGYPVNTENVSVKLKEFAEEFRSEGLEIPMITGEGDLIHPGDERAGPILRAMDSSGVRLLKLGYFRIKPDGYDYWGEVDRARRSLEGWEKLGREHNVKICYHTHSNRCLGLNCAALMHILKDFDPAFTGAYLDPCHMAIEGEEFAVGLLMAKKYLSIVALKDVLIEREKFNGHGKKVRKVVPAGEGKVDWTGVFGELRKESFAGPLSVHVEFKAAPEEFDGLFRKEIEFFRAFEG